MSQPCARRKARSPRVDLEPGMMTQPRHRRESLRRRRSMIRSTPGSSLSGSRSSKFAIRDRARTADLAAAGLARTGRAQARPRPEAHARVQTTAGRQSRASRCVGDRSITVIEQRGIAAELVDDEACDDCGIVGIEHALDADQLRDHAAAIDVADNDHRHVGAPRKAHIGDVAGAQIDLGGAAGALDQHEIGLAFRSLEAFQHRRHQRQFSAA